MTTESKYRRLPGSSGFLVRNSLWMGTDHLLSVRRNPFSESYRRYYFADVQAIMITEVPNAVAFYGYGAAALFMVMAAALAYTSHPVWCVVSLLAALTAFWVSFLSANCACYLTTSVSSDKLASLGQIRNARKAAGILKTEIEKTQGSVTAELLAAGAPSADSRPVNPRTPEVRHCNGRIHAIAFALMIVRGAASLPGPISSVPLNIAVGVLSMIVLLLLILAAIQQRRSDLALSVRRLVFAIFAFYVASGLVSIAVSIYIAFQLYPGRTNPAMFMNNPAEKAYERFDMLALMALGCIGLILLWGHWRTARTPPPLDLGNGG